MVVVEPTPIVALDLQPPSEEEAFENGFNVEKTLERLTQHQALHIFDARPESIQQNPHQLDTIRERTNLPDHATFLNFAIQELNLSDTELVGLKGKTLAVAYSKYGHGHKHQAVDMAASLALALECRVVIFDPVDGLPARENKLMLALKKVHAALQHNDPGLLQSAKDSVQRQPSNATNFLNLVDLATDKLALAISRLAEVSMPASQASGNEAISHQHDLPGTLTKILKSRPQLFGRVIELLNLTLIENTERSTACATAGLAAHYEAEAIITTIPLAIRGLSFDALRWLPPDLQTKAKHALQTIIMLIPDPGYTYRDIDPTREQNPTPTQRVDAMLLNAYHSIPRILRNLTPWLKNTLSVTADKVMGQALIDNWRTPHETIAPLGTSSDTLPPEKFRTKWSQDYRSILIASNGNGSNIPDFMQASREITSAHGSLPKYLLERQLRLDLYLADHPAKPNRQTLLPDILGQLTQEYGVSADQIQILDHTQSFLAGHPPQYDPNKLIHIGFASGDAASSDLKQWMQIWAHAEIRSPGENVITGAAVGTLELGTPPGAANEIFNMIATSRQFIAHPIDWPKPNVWSNPLYHINLPPLGPAHPNPTFPDLLDFLLSRASNSPTTRLDHLALTAYQAVDKQANPKIMALLIRELVKHTRRSTHQPARSRPILSTLPLPSRQTWVDQLIRFGRQRDKEIQHSLSLPN